MIAIVEVLALLAAAGGVYWAARRVRRRSVRVAIDRELADQGPRRRTLQAIVDHDARRRYR